MPLHIEFMNASRSPYSRAGKTLPARKGDPWLFWWTITIFLLLGLTTFTWFSCLYVFRHPEKPGNYHLLARFGKLEPLTKFNERTAPQGKFHSAKEAYARYFTFTERDLEAQNGLLKRNYIQNFTDQQPVYLKGEYRIYKVTELTPAHPFPAGLVVRAKSLELPNVSIEIVLPGEWPATERPAYGDDLTLKTNDDFAAVLHISRLPEEGLCFTVVSLTYRAQSSQDSNSLALAPPKQLNLNAAWPLSDDASQAEPTEKGRLAASPIQQ